MMEASRDVGKVRTGRSRPSDRKRTSFTLIELLVVVAIVAVLIAVLLPALNRARDLSKTTVCLSNERQFGHANLYYLTDNSDGFVYGAYTRPIDGGRTWYREGFFDYLPAPEEDKQRVYLCPADPHPWRWDSRAGYNPNGEYVNGHSVRIKAVLSYGINYRLCPYLLSVDEAQWPSRFHHLSEVATPSISCLISESSDRYLSPTLPYYWEPHHSNGSVITVLYIDGHARPYDWPVPLDFADPYAGGSSDFRYWWD